MSCPHDFNMKECEKIDAQCVNAYMELQLDPLHPEKLILSNSWKDSELDLTPAIQAGETLTHLFLSPTDAPEALQYNAERGVVDCIHGDDLSRIISMTKLKDVDQTTAPVQGDVYLYDGEKFVTFNLTDFVNTVNNTLGTLANTVQNMQTTLNSYGNRIGNLETTVNNHTAQLSDLTTRMGAAEGNITNLQGRVGTIETTLTPPANAPSGIKVTWGNINLYSDKNNTNSKNSGLYTHDLNTNVTNDERFA